MWWNKRELILKYKNTLFYFSIPVNKTLHTNERCGAGIPKNNLKLIMNSKYNYLVKEIFFWINVNSISLPVLSYMYR